MNSKSSLPPLHQVSHILFFGHPGCGKNAQADYLAEQIDAPVVSMSAYLRRHASRHTDINVEGIINTGNLVPDEIVNPAWEEAVLSLRESTSYTLVSNGSIRSAEQARFQIEHALCEDPKRRVVVVSLRLDPEMCMERILSGNRQRPDDEIDIIKHRLDLSVKAMPGIRNAIAEYYHPGHPSRRGIEFIEICTEPSIQEVRAALFGELGITPVFVKKEEKRAVAA